MCSQHYTKIEATRESNLAQIVTSIDIDRDDTCTSMEAVKESNDRDQDLEDVKMIIEQSQFARPAKYRSRTKNQNQIQSHLTVSLTKGKNQNKKKNKNKRKNKKTGNKKKMDIKDPDINSSSYMDDGSTIDINKTMKLERRHSDTKTLSFQKSSISSITNISRVFQHQIHL